jgi:glycosyltransferase involved in cell wall biosynthesis
MRGFMPWHTLSIIIPCYNCEATLEEAVVSIYKQRLPIAYEIVMVDDGSTDGTRQLIIQLAKEYPHIRYFFHEANLGGGATRNTAAKHASGDLIFCFDSDDILPENTLVKMLSYLDEKQCDGVGISCSMKFINRDINNIAYTNTFDFIDAQIPFENLFDGFYCALNCPAFLYTKKAFQVAEGYPTEHGFDTQGFAFRFLANGLKAYTCPETSYFHRIKFHRSYYMREVESGKTSHNLFKMYEEFLFLFHDEAKERILKHDLNNPEEPLSKLFANRTDQFVKNYRTLLRANAKSYYQSLLLNANNLSKYDYYWLGCEAYRVGDYDRATDYLCKSISRGLKSEKVYSKAFDSLCRLNNMEYKEVTRMIDHLYAYQISGSLLPFRRRVFDKVKQRLKGFTFKRATLKDFQSMPQEASSFLDKAKA